MLTRFKPLSTVAFPWSCTSSEKKIVSGSHSSCIWHAAASGALPWAWLWAPGVPPHQAHLPVDAKVGGEMAATAVTTHGLSSKDVAHLLQLKQRLLLLPLLMRAQTLMEMVGPMRTLGQLLMDDASLQLRPSRFCVHGPRSTVHESNVDEIW